MLTQRTCTKLNVQLKKTKLGVGFITWKIKKKIESRRVAHLASYYSTIFIKTCHFKRSLAINIAFKDEISEQKKSCPELVIWKRIIAALWKMQGICHFHSTEISRYIKLEFSSFLKCMKRMMQFYFATFSPVLIQVFFPSTLWIQKLNIE